MAETQTATGSKVVNQTGLKMAETQTTTGSKVVNLIPESLIQKWIVRDNPELAERMLVAGVQVTAIAPAQQQRPPPMPEALMGVLV